MLNQRNGQKIQRFGRELHSNRSLLQSQAADAADPEQLLSQHHIFYCQTQRLSVIAILINFNCLIDEADSFFLHRHQPF